VTKVYREGKKLYFVVLFGKCAFNIIIWKGVVGFFVFNRNFVFCVGKFPKDIAES